MPGISRWDAVNDDMLSLLRLYVVVTVCVVSMCVIHTRVYIGKRLRSFTGSLERTSARHQPLGGC